MTTISFEQKVLAQEYGVHAEHCCAHDSYCKYSLALCPVVAGLVAQRYPCEMCDFDED